VEDPNPLVLPRQNTEGFVKRRAAKLVYSFCQQAEIGSGATAIPPYILTLFFFSDTIYLWKQELIRDLKISQEEQSMWMIFFSIDWESLVNQADADRQI
jgi:hypothetical protein